MASIVSAIICTHNRYKYLPQAIDSLINQTSDRDLYEIIIVDNCSTDRTKEIINNYLHSQNSKFIKYIYESRIGLSYARNTGWKNASGKYIAYLDDDGIASKNWIEQIIHVFNTVRPMPGCAGGRVLPIWEADRPHWLSNDLLGGLALIDWSETPFFISDISINWLIGGNIAFPLSVIKQLYGFESGMDRTGKKLLSNGDILIERQIQKAGYKCYYDPKIEIHHTIPKERLLQKWFLNRYYWQGISDAFMNNIENKLNRKQCITLAYKKLLELYKEKNKLNILIGSTSNPDNFTTKCFRLIDIGQMIGYLKLCFNHKVI